MVSIKKTGILKKVRKDIGAWKEAVVVIVVVGVCGGGGYGGQGSVDIAYQRSNRSKWLAKEESRELGIVRSPSSR